MAEGQWALVELDERFAKRHGVPQRIPVPQAHMETTAEKGMSSAEIRTWISDFLKAAPADFRKQNAELAAGYDAYIGKWPHWDKAQRAFASRDFEGAIKSLKLVTRLDRNDYAARMNLAMALASSGKLAEAQTALREIAPVFVGDAEFHSTLGNVELSLGNRDAALEAWVIALEASPSCRAAMEGLVQLGVLVAIYEDPRDAVSLTYVRTDSLVSHLESVWSSAERPSRYFLDQIAYHEGEGRHPAALAAAEAGAKVAVGTTDQALMTGAAIRALRGLGRHDEALARAKGFCEANPECVAARVELGQCLVAKGQQDPGRHELDEALRLDPGDQQALALRFWPEDHSDLEKLNESIPALEQHAGNHPDCAGAWRSLARARIAVGAIDGGLAEFRRAVALAPADDDQRAEYWGELGKAGRFEDVLTDAQALENMAERNWKLRWNEAEALNGVGRKNEARVAFTALNRDESLLIDIRRRAKRAAERG